MLNKEKKMGYIEMLAGIDFHDESTCPYLKDIKEWCEETLNRPFDITSSEDRGYYFVYLLAYWKEWWKHGRKKFPFWEPNDHSGTLED